jgi:hypothetical protein
MPSIKEKKSFQRAAVSAPHGAGEQSGEPPPRPGILDRMPDEIRRKLPDSVGDELLGGASSEEEIVGPGGLLSQLTKRLVERALEVELTEHLGYERHLEPPGGAENQRNGSTRKTLQTEHGPVEINTPRDPDGSFEPKLVRKRQRRFEGFDEKILALYSRGLSTRDIERYLRELYGVSVGRELISRVTDAVMDDARAWQQRPLEDVYLVVFLDCMVLKIRDGGSVQRRACYIAMGITMTGDRDVLGLWFQDNEGAKFWVQVLGDLKHRGVRDILICCVDGLKGFPEAIERSSRSPSCKRASFTSCGSVCATSPAAITRKSPATSNQSTPRRRRRGLGRAGGLRSDLGRAVPADRVGLGSVSPARSSCRDCCVTPEPVTSTWWPLRTNCSRVVPPVSAAGSGRSSASGAGSGSVGAERRSEQRHAVLLEDRRDDGSVGSAVAGGWS